MNYKEKLVEFIKNKAAISENGIVSLSIEEIAEVWSKNVLYEDERFSSQHHKMVYIDHGFLTDVRSAIKTLKKDGLISFKCLSLYEHRDDFNSKSISNITRLWALRDRIVLKVLEKKDKKLAETINEIICVRPEPGSTKFRIIINKNYNDRNSVWGDQGKPSWKLLFDIADGKKIVYAKQHKNAIDYFKNPKNKIYTRTEYKPIKMLKINYYIVPNKIKMSVISEKAYKQRLKMA